MADQEIANKVFYIYDKDTKLSDRDRLLFNAGFMACFEGMCKGTTKEIDFINYEELNKC
jgi:hypothetical protein